MKQVESLEALYERYEKYSSDCLQINLERGWPCKEQLDLSMAMLDIVTSETKLDREVDYRGYAGTAGIEPMRKLFADILDVSSDEIYIGGTMSTTLMYDVVNKAMLFGLNGMKPWKDDALIKFICPSPGYEKHFKICTTFGIEMIPVRINKDGPDMDEVERLVLEDESIKGIWCVPLYSNPTGTVYSDETVKRLASMRTKAEDFRIFWDNAYCVHHLTKEKRSIMNIIREAARCGNPDRVFEFTSTSKITFPGGGVAVCASSESNIKWLTENSLLQLKSGDKINQLRHFLFLKDEAGVYAHMDKHREIIAPKFELVDRILREELDGWDIAWWDQPKGGYFFNINLKPNMAHCVWEKCKKLGVLITPAGSTFPYGNDPEDAYLRIAPTYPPVSDLAVAIHVLGLCIKITYLEAQGG